MADQAHSHGGHSHGGHSHGGHSHGGHSHGGHSHGGHSHGGHSHGGHSHGGHSHGGHSHGGHSHGGHSHGGHSHGGTRAGSEGRLLLALLLTGGFMVIEVLGGLISGSLALIADAGHMLTDTAALALSWLAVRAARRPATPERSYGQHRFQVLAAFINGSTLIVVAIWIAVEAADRFFSPVPVMAGPMLVVAAAGLAINIAAFLILNSGNRDDMNVRGAILHVLGDLLGSVGAIAAALIILWTGWTPIDPILSVLVALLILRGAWDLVRRSWHVLMEGAPPDLDVARLRAELPQAVAGVVDVHHVHAWSLTPERTLLTLHAAISDQTDHDTALHGLKSALATRFGVEHATIQVERACTDARAPDGKAAATS